ncbi:MAG: alpha/beta hydrolase [Actinomycetota bacterium]|nr:alpha/beta hydrolase [Actinomycetota bacterium]
MPFARVADTDVHYLDAGSGAPAVVLLHAFPLNAAMWQPQLDALADRWRVVAPDLAPEQAPEPSMDGMADAVAGLLGHLGIGQAVVGGLSMGGYVAFALLRRHRDLVRALVLADTRPGADTAEIRERRTSQQEQVRSEGTAGLVETMVGNLLSDETRERRSDVVARAREIMQQSTPDHIVAALEAMKRRPDSSAELAGIDFPALVVVGEHDGPTPPAVAEEMASQLPRAHLIVVPGAGHLSSLEAPEVFNAELRSFLKRV